MWAAWNRSASVHGYPQNGLYVPQSACTAWRLFSAADPLDGGYCGKRRNRLFSLFRRKPQNNCRFRSRSCFDQGGSGHPHTYSRRRFDRWVRACYASPITAAWRRIIVRRLKWVSLNTEDCLDERIQNTYKASLLCRTYRELRRVEISAPAFFLTVLKNAHIHA